jgi:hypothetical protein
MASKNTQMTQTGRAWAESGNDAGTGQILERKTGFKTIAAPKRACRERKPNLRLVSRQPGKGLAKCGLLVHREWQQNRMKT